MAKDEDQGGPQVDSPLLHKTEEPPLDSFWARDALGLNLDVWRGGIVLDGVRRRAVVLAFRSVLQNDGETRVLGKPVLAQLGHACRDQEMPSKYRSQDGSDACGR